MFFYWIIFMKQGRSHHPSPPWAANRDFWQFSAVFWHRFGREDPWTNNPETNNPETNNPETNNPEA